mmetsp:Transcript_23163/g.74520  ORF Transcript_23163/g.74520 Transcript_23163/m.74520 type:complete len:265 (-) Transcript_23163:96-890(-)
MSLRDRDFWRPVYTELLGTTFFVFIAAGIVTISGNVAMEEMLPPRLVLIALTQGLGYAMALYACTAILEGGIGFFNPAITLAALLTNNIHGAYRWKGSPTRGALFLIVAQVAGSILGGVMVLGAVPNAMDGEEKVGATVVGQTTSTWMAMALEALGTFFMTWVVLSELSRRDVRPQSFVGPLAVGTGYAALQIAFLPYSGASFNPARSFGPALCAQQLSDLHVHILAPLAGSMVAAIAFALTVRGTSHRSLLGTDPAEVAYKYD